MAPPRVLTRHRRGSVVEVVAVAVGTALAAAAYHAVQQKPARVAVRLTFPRTISDTEAVAAFRSLTGLLPPWWRRIFGAPVAILEAHASPSGIAHVLRLPAPRADYVLGSLRAALPGLRVSDKHVPSLPEPALARELRLAGSGGLRTDAGPATNANVLAALQPLVGKERIVVQYAISPIGRGPIPSFDDVVNAIRGEQPVPASQRPTEPELGVAIRVGIAAESARARQLAARVLGSFHPLRTDEARLSRRVLPSRLVAAKMRDGAGPDHGASALRADELAALAGIPLDGPGMPGLTMAQSRELPPDASVPRRGLVLGDSTVAGGPRPVAVTRAEARRSIQICAPTGAGKSTVLLNLAVQAADSGLAVVDSKGDLIADICDRIRADRRSDVIVFDPADTERPVGFNLIGGAGDTDLIVDHVIGQLRARYGAAGLGPRSEDICRAALLTLAREPGMTLCEVEPLLANAAFRQRLVGRLDEPVLESFWAWYGSLSDAARAEAIAPLANKLRTYTLRRRVRAVIGQSEGLDLDQVLSKGRVLLVSLAKGTVGEDAAALIGSAMVSRLWTAIQARAALPPDRRRPFTVICDEFQDFARLPVALGDAIAQSRGYKVGWVLAHQHLAQLDAATRADVLANCRSKLVMQTTAADASLFAREFAPHLHAADLQGLGPFEGYAAISTGAAVAPPASVRTRPAPDALGVASAVRAGSRKRYGTPVAETEAAIRKRILGSRGPTPIGGTRRSS